MGNNILNGTTATWNAVGVDKIRDLRVTDGGEEIDITGLSDSTEIWDVGLDDVEVEITVIGVSTLARGDKQNLIITWPDASTKTLTNGVITSVEKGGSLNGEITSVIRMRQGEA